MTTAKEIREDIDANWQGVYDALRTVVRLEERVTNIESDVAELKSDMKTVLSILRRR